MKTTFLSVLDALRASYWFFPATMSIAAIALSFAFVAVDGAIGAEWLKKISWLHGNTPDGARTILSTIAGSMITVAGVVFSITIATVSYAAGQYGPRVLSNFLRDRANQFTLGTFVATFLYCLLVIRSVRETTDSEITSVGQAFVPNLSLLTGIALALCSIAVLIFFVHHVARSIHISHIIADIGQELHGLLDEHYPPIDARETGTKVKIGDDQKELPPPFRSGDAAPKSSVDFDGTKTIPYPDDGFIQTVNFENLLSVAQSNGVVVRLRSHPGDFVRHSATAIEAWPSVEISEDLAEKLQKTFTIGRMRTPVQDIMFLIDQLVEIAGRALSPGVNDPFTAKNCINWLGVAIDNLSVRPDKSPYIADDDGMIRIVFEPFDFEDFVSAAFGQLRSYAAADVNCAVYLVATLAGLAVRVDDTDRTEILKTQISLLADASQAKLSPPDRELVKRRVELAMKMISRGRDHQTANTLREVQHIP